MEKNLKWKRINIEIIEKNVLNMETKETELSSELQVFLGKKLEKLGGVHAKSLQSRLTLWELMGSSVNGIL